MESTAGLNMKWAAIAVWIGMVFLFVSCGIHKSASTHLPDQSTEIKDPEYVHPLKGPDKMDQNVLPSGLIEKYWRLVSLNGKPVIPDADEPKEAYMILKSMEGRVQGNGGCNSFSGTYTLWGENGLTFNGIISTRMACPALPAETEFLQVLHLTTGFRVRNDSLWLTNSKAASIATFVAVNMH